MCVFASLSRNLNRVKLNTPNSPPLLACFTTLKHILHTNKEHRPLQPNSYWDSNWMSEWPLKDKAWRSPFKTHPWLFAFVALQHWAAYAAATESSDGVCAAAACEWQTGRCSVERRSRHKQLCVSNASSRIWVTLAPLIVSQFYDLNYIPVIQAF